MQGSNRRERETQRQEEREGPPQIKKMPGGDAFAKTICSICYEDLKPIVEDLQSISICGHVFHELCIQQWFEYCTNGKKKNCPVCKQTCSESNVNRLYFQSVGDPNDPSLSQKSNIREEDTNELRIEVKRLEGKVLGLTSTLERQQKDLQDMNEELYDCKEQLKKEASLKTDALKQIGTIKQLLHLKSQELDKSTLESMRLQERSMALAKELAALKLVSDVNLEEDDVLKLASLGAEGNTKGTIDVLRKSLVIRNKSYKELISKCNSLGRGESRSLHKLEKANEKIVKLKARMQELETALEMKENEVLRTLTTNKTNSTTDKRKVLGSVSKASVLNKCSSEDKLRESSVLKEALDEAGGTPDTFCSRKTKRLKHSNDVSTNNNDNSISSYDQSTRPYILIDEERSEVSKLPEFSHFGSIPRANENAATKSYSFSRPEMESQRKNVAHQHEPSKIDSILGSRNGNKDQATSTRLTSSEEDVVVLEKSKQDQPLLNITKENSPALPLLREGESCFSGGLLGPDGTKWHLGKWCKRSQGKGLTTQGSSANTGDLIAVGADGRGGTIKVLKSLNHSSMETSVLEKKSKFGGKTSSSQSPGCLQIEHFFGRAGR